MSTGSAQNGPGLRVVFLGTPDSAAPTLRAVVGAGFPVPLVITNPDRRKGRGGGKVASPVKAAALELGLPVFQPESINEPESLTHIHGAEPDVILIVAYGQILKKAVLQAPRRMPLNLHFSMLPQYRGASPVTRAIADGKTETGVSLQRIVARLDAGPILASERVEIGPEETAGELTARLAEVGAALTVRTLERLARGDVEETPQDDSLATKAPLLKKADGRIDWTKGARELHCHVRAMNPWPGAQAVYHGASRKGELPLTVLSCRVGSERETGRPPGEVILADADGITAQTGEGQIVLDLLKPAGKRALSPREFVNGYRAAPGDRFS